MFFTYNFLINEEIMVQTSWNVTFLLFVVFPVRIKNKNDNL